MTSWYSLDLDSTIESEKIRQRIVDSFISKYIGMGRPLDMAVFSSKDKDANLASVYFSPKAASLAMQFGASPCGNNFIDMELSLLVGDEDSIDLLFPDVDTR